ncbi:conserved hypothetical protein [Uncinocarpus reesii 1704]|uniref:DUF1774-domain-containing protein n=1 Tax=Uncinocarpus reesii (strain UAMH 1704) TaxID=336963 RepID=C4JH71_UNCRE|nr:uncharacterized protein UREG_02644 [Uncinocarpus reesii 1704]EEP77795.1 conserved hypothetical protein [Uncinocarpus reesii 1704]
MADTTGSRNPFARRTSHGPKAINAYRALTPLSWLLVVVFGIYYSVRRPDDDHHGSTIGKQAEINPTPFSQTKTITTIYWVILLLSQLGYMGQLWSSSAERLTAAANVAPYYILNNLFILSFVLLWVRSHFWGAEIFDIASLINQGMLYWRYPGLPQLIHLPAVAGPYAWSITTLFWNGAVAVGGYSLPKRIVANVFIWVMFLFGQAHVAHRSDQALGYSFSLLTLSLALKQFSLKIISLQWIFAFVIFGLFLVSSLYSSTARYHKRDFFFRSLTEPEAGDRERQPLLGNE